MLVVGCGGSPSRDAAPDPGQGAQAQASPSAMHSAAADAQGAAPRYNLVLLNDRTVHQDLDQLDPRIGKGYAPLHAFIYVKGKPRSSSPVASIKPICLTATRCEYLPPRKAGFAERYVISIDDGSVAQLSADSDLVVITSRQLGLARPATVNVTLTIPGQQPVVKRIFYAAALS